MAQEDKKLQNGEIRNKELDQVTGGSVFKMSSDSCHLIICNQCGIQFTVLSNSSTACPHCGSTDVRKEM